MTNWAKPLRHPKVKKHFQGTGIVSPLDGVVQLHEKSSSKLQNPSALGLGAMTWNIVELRRENTTFLDFLECW